MSPQQLMELLSVKKSCLCVGLDVDESRIPSHLFREANPLLSFNRQIIEATLPFAVAYKLNIAFYEMLGSRGWDLLESTLSYIPNDVLIIADAKRGDIGNSSKYYAQTFFERYAFDAVTVSPYMGTDSVAPFLAYEDKWTFLLALTSNSGSKDFQLLSTDDVPLYRRVIETSQGWVQNSPGYLGFVVGATQTEELGHIRSYTKHHFLLVPGVGTQGGSVAEVCRSCLTSDGGILINSSRSIIYAGNGKDFAKKSALIAKKLQEQMAFFL